MARSRNCYLHGKTDKQQSIHVKVHPSGLSMNITVPTRQNALANITTYAVMSCTCLEISFARTGFVTCFFMVFYSLNTSRYSDNCCQGILVRPTVIYISPMNFQGIGKFYNEWVPFWMLD